MNALNANIKEKDIIHIKCESTNQYLFYVTEQDEQNKNMITGLTIPIIINNKRRAIKHSDKTIDTNITKKYPDGVMHTWYIGFDEIKIIKRNATKKYWKENKTKIIFMLKTGILT